MRFEVSVVTYYQNFAVIYGSLRPVLDLFCCNVQLSIFQAFPVHVIIIIIQYLFSRFDDDLPYTIFLSANKVSYLILYLEESYDDINVTLFVLPCIVAFGFFSNVLGNWLLSDFLALPNHNKGAWCGSCCLCELYLQYLFIKTR